ncbi:hypothetical protein [Streptomyces sp. NPDC093071]|uniref:hypothetical protein n=1 Tax=Streptomyces sp. NPDC093071 TaxID=3366022 RepID=UPI0037F67481
MRAPRFNPLHLAGWLFADMLLVLALVAMGDQGDPLAAEAPTGPKATTSPKPGPSKTPAPKGPRAVTRTPVKVSLDAPPGDRATMREQLRKITARYEGRQAAFVLTFGHHPEPGLGGDYATDVNSQLAKARPDMFRGATTRDFWKGAPSGGHADLEIYFYTY